MTTKALLILILTTAAAAALALGAACYLESQHGGCKVASFALPCPPAAGQPAEH